ncbi:MAG: GHMP kinase [bacterium]
MIIVRAPLRISFVGGGTDLPDFYKKYPGRVISTAIDKYIYLVINPSYYMDDYILKYQITEKVKHPSDISHDRFRAALLDFGMTDKGIEIGTFADIPAKTGLGSSSSFTVALMKGLNAYFGRTIDEERAAKEACRLEIDILNEPIGKQDQYSAAYGGFNIFQFNPDGSVERDPILISHEAKKRFEDHLVLFFTGITRNASDVLMSQKAKILENFETYKLMSDSVYKFKDKLLAEDFRGLAEMLHEGWLRKKSLSENASNSVIDFLYSAGINSGAWGGKILGAGGGGCILFIAPPEKHAAIKENLEKTAKDNCLQDFKMITAGFVQSGTDVIFNSNI